MLLVLMFHFEGGARFNLTSRTGIRQGMLKIVIEEVIWSIRGSYQTIWSFHLTNIKWHSVPWQYTMTTPTDQTFYRTRPFTEFWEVFIEHLRRSWHADRGRLLFRTPGPVFLGLAYILLIETNPFSKLVIIFQDFALRISFGTFSILLVIWLQYLMDCLHSSSDYVLEVLH